MIATSEAELTARRSGMSLAERVESRRVLDLAAGVVYPELSDERAAELAELLSA